MSGSQNQPTLFEHARDLLERRWQGAQTDLPLTVVRDRESNVINARPVVAAQNTKAVDYWGALSRQGASSEGASTGLNQGPGLRPVSR